MLEELSFLTNVPVTVCFQHQCLNTVDLREQVKPLLFGDGLLPQQLQYYGTHQVPFILKLKGAFVLETDRREVKYTIQTVHELCWHGKAYPSNIWNINNTKQNKILQLVIIQQHKLIFILFQTPFKNLAIFH